MQLLNRFKYLIKGFSDATKLDSPNTVNFYSTVLYDEQIKIYYKDVTFGINCSIENPGYIRFGKNCRVLHHTGIHAITNYYGEYFPSIEIGEGTQIGAYNAIAAINKILIGNNVLFGPYVHISDHSHDYQDINKPIMHQPAISKGPIIIKDDCWLGFGCHIMSGVNIGKHSIIGANSVVTKDIPAYSVAVGMPAKVVKKFNFSTNLWERVYSGPDCS